MVGKIASVNLVSMIDAVHVATTIVSLGYLNHKYFTFCASVLNNFCTNAPYHIAINNVHNFCTKLYDDVFTTKFHYLQCWLPQ